MNAMKCPLCDSNSFTADATGEYTRCDHCGTKYNRETVKKIVVEGLHGVDKLAENAETFLSMGNTIEADRAFSKLTTEHPRDYRGWFGLARMLDLNIRGLMRTMRRGEKFDMPDEYKWAIQFAPDDEKKRIEDYYAAEYEKYSNEATQLFAEEKVLLESRNKLMKEDERLSKMHKKVSDAEYSYRMSSLKMLPHFLLVLAAAVLSFFLPHIGLWALVGLGGLFILRIPFYERRKFLERYLHKERPILHNKIRNINIELDKIEKKELKCF